MCCTRTLHRPPFGCSSGFLSEDFYYDTVNFDVRALQFAIDFAGAEHLVAGSDFPHQIGSMEKMQSSIRTLSISEDDRAAILSGNATRLLGL